MATIIDSSNITTGLITYVWTYNSNSTAPLNTDSTDTNYTPKQSTDGTIWVPYQDWGWSIAPYKNTYRPEELEKEVSEKKRKPKRKILFV